METAPRKGRNATYAVLLVIVVGVVAAVGAESYYFPPQTPTPPVTVVSAILGAFAQGQNATYISGTVWVQNTGTKPVVSLSGTIPGLPRMSLNIASFLSGILYPNELGYLTAALSRQGGAPEFASGTSHTITMTARFSDGTNATFTSALTAGECGSGSSPAFLSFGIGNFGVDSSGQATLQLTARTNTSLPVVGVAVGVNNGTLWFPFKLFNAPVSPSNPLRSGTNDTQTFTWKDELGTYQVVQWVGECANQNGMSKASIV